MGLNIAITSKYDPFTYEDYIKPLEGYWEDYDKHEADLDKLATDTATLREVINSMPEGEEKTKYTGYLESLDAQAGSLATSGLNSANRKALRDLKNQYASLMPRLALAEEARRKDLAEYRKLANSGEYFLYNDSPESKSVVDYLDGKLPSYNAGISKKELGLTAKKTAEEYSSRIFPDASIKEVEEAGKKFMKITQTQGVNTALENVDSTFASILHTLYDEAGVDNMSSAEAAKTKDFINRNFWEGLVYKKATDYRPITTSNDKSPYSIIAPLAGGYKLIRSGDKHFILDNAGNFIGEYKSPDDKTQLTPGQQEEDYDKTTYLRKTVEGFDNWRFANIYNPDKVADHDEDFTNDPKELVGKYISSVTSPDTTPDRHRSNLITKDISTLYDKALMKAKNKSLFKKYRRPEDTIFIGSGSAIGKRTEDDMGEFWGDNHISLMNVDTFFEHLPTNDRQLFPVLEDIYKAYSEIPNHEAPKKVLKKLDAYIKALVGMDRSDKSLDQKKKDALETLKKQNEYLYNLLVPGNSSTDKVQLPD